MSAVPCHGQGNRPATGHRTPLAMRSARAVRILIARLVTSCLALPLLVAVADAAPIPWEKKVVSYVSDRRPLRQVVKDVLATQAFPVVVTGDIRGEVTGQFNEPADRVFAKLAAAYGIVWFFDGSVLYISPGSDLRSEVVELGAVDPARVHRTLAALGLLEERFPVKVAGGKALVSGPSRYVNLVVRALRAEVLTAPVGGSVGASGGAAGRKAGRAAAAAGNRQVRVYPLTHAQAADVVHEVNGRRETIPGVASLLRRLGQSGNGLRLDEEDPLWASTPDGPFNERLSAVRSGDRGPDSSDVRRETAFDDAIVEADVRTNSVIVHANKDLLDSYGEVISRLDLPKQLVQIDVTILNVARSAARDVGVALGATVRDAPSPTSADDGSASSSGLLFEGILGTSRRNITVRVAALEQAGRVKVTSRPKLVGLENLQAVVGSQTTAYVRVAGTYQTDLYPVRAGLQLKVTPRVVSKAGEPTVILLALAIVDGNLQQSVRVDGIPVSREVAISTQAMVGEGQTLLIGGHQQENIGREHAGVPGLSRVPVIGALFRRRRNNHELSEQLFLITPRLLASNERSTPHPASELPLEPATDCSAPADQADRHCRASARGLVDPKRGQHSK